MSDDKIDLAGFSINDTSRVNYLSAFDGVRGIGFEMKNVIPASASYVVHHSFDDVEKWHRGLKNYWRKHEPAQLTRIGEIENKYQFNIQDFYSMIAHEVGLFYIASNRPKHPDKILCIQHKEQPLAEQVWDNLSVKTTTDSVRYHERYQGRDIYKINIDELPSRFFGDLFNGFEASFYFIDNEFVYFGNSQQALEVMIDAVENEDTWRKSVKTNDFLESTNDDANFSIYIKTSGLVDMLSYQLNDSWAKFLDENQPVLQQIEYGVIQFTNVDDTYYTNISINHPGELIAQVLVAQLELQSSVSFENHLISKPFGVRNHNDKSLEMMVQDENFNLHLISKSQEITLTIPLEGPLTSKIYQLDYYKNGKLQYLFSLAQSVHLIDRTGTYIPGFPKSVTLADDLVILSLLDYDQSRNYRLLVGDNSGKFRMMDKSGKTLKGWKSKQMLGKPSMQASHLRIGKTDILLFPLKNGIVQVLNRKGDSKKGFPIDLNGDFTSEVYIEKGSSLANSFVTAISDLGELVTFNLTGNITNREQILRESSEAKFKMVIANNKKSYVIVKEESNQRLIYDQSLEERFVIPKLSDNMQYQYYKFDADHQLIIVHDHENLRSFLYDMNGKMIHQGSLVSNDKLAVVNHAAQGLYQIYASSGTELTVVSLSRL